MDKKARLGRGLDALIGGTPGADQPAVLTQAEVRVDQIHQNPYQPRKAFDEEELQTLSDSIRHHGILQPLVVRPVDDGYQLIAGERRLRAARSAGLSAVPVRVVDFNDQQVLEAALVENIHRTDLNPIEKAQGFKDYLDRFQMTHEQLAARLGLGRPSITNLVGLLDLPKEIQDAVRTGQVSPGHAKVLKGVEEAERQISLCKEVIARGLSVHALDNLIKEQQSQAEASEEGSSPSGGRSSVEKTAHVRGLEDELRQRLSTKVEIKLRAKDRGQIVIGFETNDDFERVMEALRK